MHRSSTLLRALSPLLVVGLLVGACGDDDDVATDDDTTSTTVSATAPDESSTTEPDAIAETPVAVWPAADVVFDTPEAVAADFVESVLGVPPTLGEFQPGDSRSGEMVVFSPGEGDAATPVERSLLLLRQLGPDDGWFVLAAVNEHVSIVEPESGSNMVPGPLPVEGLARGFEGTVVVRALGAGSADVIDEVITQGGSAAEPVAYSETLDLSSVEAGDVVMVLVRGGTGLETDPGEFSAVPVLVR